MLKKNIFNGRLTLAREYEFMITEKLVSTKEAAEVLGVSNSTIYRMIEQGLLEPSKTPGGQRRFSISVLEDFKENSKLITAPQNPSKLKINNYEIEEEQITNKIIEPEQRIQKCVDKRNTLNDLNGSQAWGQSIRMLK